MNLNIEDLTGEQKEFVSQYQTIYNRLTTLQDQMRLIEIETEELISALQKLRKKETKLFNNG